MLDRFVCVKGREVNVQMTEEKIKYYMDICEETAVMEENHYGKPSYVIDTNLLKLVKL